MWWNSMDISSIQAAETRSTPMRTRGNHATAIVHHVLQYDGDVLCYRTAMAEIGTEHQ